jgi:F0F1-type ATP synthase membrane subunit b/b'
MTQDNRNNFIEALCWAALVAAFALMITGYMAERERRIATSQQRIDKLERQCDSLQQQIDYIVE